MYFVYVLECADKTLYTGITNDLAKRLAAHSAGKGSKYVRSRLPVRVVYSEHQPDRATASKREAEIKKMPRSQKLSLLEIYAAE
jgi:putative endonuclease